MEELLGLLSKLFQAVLGFAILIGGITLGLFVAVENVAGGILIAFFVGSLGLGLLMKAGGYEDY